MNFPVPWRALLPVEAVPVVSGPQGATLRDVCDATGAGIDISNEGETPETLSDKICTLSGTVEQKEAACRRMVDKLRGLQEVADQEPGIFVILVPSSAAPMVVGQKGAQIKEVIELSGAEISVGKENVLGMVDQPIGITGTGGQVVSAVSKINAILQDLADRGRLQPSDFKYRPGVAQQGGLHMEPTGGMRGPAFSGGNPRTNAKFVVATQVAGWIIGKQGRHIRELQENSGSHIQVLKEGEVPRGVSATDRVIEIGGRHEAKAEGIQIVLMAIDSMPALQAPRETQMLLPRGLTTDAEIKDVQQMSGSEVEVRELPGHEEALCTLLGTIEARVKAAQRFLVRVEEVVHDGTAGTPTTASPPIPDAGRALAASRTERSIVSMSTLEPTPGSSPPATSASSAKFVAFTEPEKEETRVAPDGEAYTKEQFLEFYNGLKEWDEAAKDHEAPKGGATSTGEAQPVAKSDEATHPSKMAASSAAAVDPWKTPAPKAPVEDPWNALDPWTRPTAPSKTVATEPQRGELPSRPTNGHQLGDNGTHTFGAPSGPASGCPQKTVNFSPEPTPPSVGTVSQISFSPDPSHSAAPKSFTADPLAGGDLKTFTPDTSSGVGIKSFSPEPTEGTDAAGSGLQMSFSPMPAQPTEQTLQPLMSFSPEPRMPTSFSPGRGWPSGVTNSSSTSFTPASFGAGPPLMGLGGMGAGIGCVGGIGGMLGGMLGSGIGGSTVASEATFQAALHQSGMMGHSFPVQLLLLLPSELLSQALVPSGHLAEIARKCGIRIDIGDEGPPGMCQVSFTGSVAANAMAAYFLQERSVQCGGGMRSYAAST